MLIIKIYFDLSTGKQTSSTYSNASIAIIYGYWGANNPPKQQTAEEVRKTLEHETTSHLLIQAARPSALQEPVQTQQSQLSTQQWQISPGFALKAVFIQLPDAVAQS